MRFRVTESVLFETAPVFRQGYFYGIVCEQCCVRPSEEVVERAEDTLDVCAGDA